MRRATSTKLLVSSFILICTLLLVDSETIQPPVATSSETSLNEASLGAANSSTSLKELTTADPLGASPSFLPETVLADGMLTGAWSKCAALSDATLSASTELGCRIDKDYQDRISFAFTAAFEHPKESYNLGKPAVSHAGGAALPSVSEYVFDPQTNQGSFTVFYNCQREGAETEVFSSLELSLSVSNETAVEFRWGKLCKSGVNKLLDLSYEANDGETVSFYNDFQRAHALIVPPTVALTQLHMSIAAPAVYQRFEPASVSSSASKVVSVVARGIAGNGTLTAGAPTILSIMYECLSLGKATIEVKIPVPPWSDLTASFRKDCGGGIAKSVSIGTALGKADVVRKGVPVRRRPRVQVDMTNKPLHGSAFSSSKEIPDVPATQEAKKFFIQFVGTKDDGPLHFSDVIVTVGEHDMARVLIGGFLSGKDYWHQQASGILSEGDSHILNLNIICLRAGLTQITVSLPMLRYKTVEFSFTKECAAPSVHTEASLFNVGAIEDMLIAGILLGILVFALLVLRRRRNLDSMAVSLPRTGKNAYQPVLPMLPSHG